jgi:hypothetical protein
VHEYGLSCSMNPLDEEELDAVAAFLVGSGVGALVTITKSAESAERVS